MKREGVERRVCRNVWSLEDKELSHLKGQECKPSNSKISSLKRVFLQYLACGELEMQVIQCL